MNFEAIGQFFIDIASVLYANYSLYMTITFLLITMAIIGILALLKMPIKKLTEKITNVKLRKFANKSLIVIGFGLSVGFWFFLNWLFPQFAIPSWTNIFVTWGFSQIAYAIGDGVIDFKKAKEVTENVVEIAKDNKIDKDEKEIIKSCIDRINKI